MKKIVAFDGDNEIVCTRLFLEAANKKLFFGFTLNCRSRGLYYGEFLNTRAANIIGDSLFLGLVPPIQGLYRSNSVQSLNKNGSDSSGDCSRELSSDAVFSSHARLYHSAYVALLSEELPIYVFATTISALKSSKESGDLVFENKMLDFKRRTFTDKNDEIGSHNLNNVNEL